MFRKALLALLLTVPAQAATISITADKANYQTGEQILLTIHGDAEGGLDVAVFGRLSYSGSMTNTLESTQTPLSTNGEEWIVGSLGHGDGYADIMNQIYGFEPGTPDDPFVGSATLLATAPGELTIGWSTAPGFELDYFDATGSTLTVSISGTSIEPPPVVVEPPPVIELPPPPVGVEPPPVFEPPSEVASSGSPAPEPSGALLFPLALVMVKVASRRKAR